LTTTETIEPAYVLDTNVLIWALTKREKLSPRVSIIFEAAVRGETELVVSAIVIAELFYSDKKWGWFDDFAPTYSEMKAQSYFRFVSMDADDILDFTRDAAVPEMHDRIIAGLARRLDLPLLTVDPLITASGVVEVIW
jgi:predicted nucleic acid-binding protein